MRVVSVYHKASSPVDVNLELDEVKRKKAPFYKGVVAFYRHGRYNGVCRWETGRLRNVLTEIVVKKETKEVDVWRLGSNDHISAKVISWNVKTKMASFHAILDKRNPFTRKCVQSCKIKKQALLCGLQCFTLQMRKFARNLYYYKLIFSVFL